jgi:hypothetical protein
MPRGIAGGVAPVAAGAALVHNPLTLGLLGFQSPRLMGELSQVLGALERKITPTFKGAAISGISGAVQQHSDNKAKKR